MLFCEAGPCTLLCFHVRLALTWELMMRMVVLFPTSRAYPSVGAALKRRTASWESERRNTLRWPRAGTSQPSWNSIRLGVMQNPAAYPVTTVAHSSVTVQSLKKCTEQTSSLSLEEKRKRAEIKIQRDATRYFNKRRKHESKHQ